MTRTGTLPEDSADNAVRIYRDALAGRFEGILTWPDLDALWTRLRTAPEGWYVHDPDAPPPDRPASETAFRQALDRAEAMFSHARSRDWCGAVYVDDRNNPGLVKIFDPFGMSACGGGSAATRPWLILSRIPPAPLADPAESPRRRGLLSRLAHRG